MAGSVGDTEAGQRLPNATGGIARLACRRASEAGLDLAPLLREAGVTPQQIEDPGARLKVYSQIKLLTLIAAALPDPLLGFHLARDFEFRQLGLLHYVMASSDTLGDALQRAVRYSTIVNEGVSLKYREANDLLLSFDYVGVARHSDRHQIEFWITAFVRGGRELSGRQVIARQVQFTHHHHGDCSEFSAYVGSDIEFGAARDAIVFPRAIGELPVVSADPYLNNMMVKFCDDALAQRAPGAGALRTSIENAIAPLLPHGKARLGEVARTLGMGERTMARRLAAEGLSFGGVLDALRADLARRHVGESDYSISQIAWLLGYQEVSAFTHAFRRWTGSTPSAVRSRARTPD
jgi:AraC-like DNA-binding protein